MSSGPKPQWNTHRVGGDALAEGMLDRLVDRPEARWLGQRGDGRRDLPDELHRHLHGAGDAFAELCE